MASESDLLRWSETLAALARTGLGFTESLYEKERFEEILHVAADIRARANDDVGDADQIVQEWLGSVGRGVPGYVTPKVTVGAVVGNDQGELLLIQRSDSGVWLFPTGWCDVGYSPTEMAVREVHEETGIEVEPVRLISILDGMRQGFTRAPIYSIVFHCRATGGTLKPHPLECLDAGFFSEDNLPDNVANFDRWGPQAFAAVRGEPLDVHYDPPRPEILAGAGELPPFETARNDERDTLL